MLAKAEAQDTTMIRSLPGLETPCLVLDATKMRRNIERLRVRLDGLGVAFRPHMKTSKSVEIVREMLGERVGAVTVSTLNEAEHALASGLTDILYAVAVAPAKLPRVRDIRRRGANLAVVAESVSLAREIGAFARAYGEPIRTFVEVDCDGHRGGVRPTDTALVEIGRALAEGGAVVGGVMAHAGGSYALDDAEARADAGEAERAAAFAAAEKLRAAGFATPVVSVGSTPTAFGARHLTGVTEVRAGVFAFFDLVMAGIGVCAVSDIALSVAASVLGHTADGKRIVIDAGWTAMSRDRGTRSQRVDQFYGLVCDAAGVPFEDLVLVETNQEHGLVAVRPGGKGELPPLEVGDVVRILPNHACATAAQHDKYLVLGDRNEVAAVWPRFRGW
jgi:D-serine deaminase-like pyridoxal phosphate-dependent protein